MQQQTAALPVNQSVGTVLAHLISSPDSTAVHLKMMRLLFLCLLLLLPAATAVSEEIEGSADDGLDDDDEDLYRQRTNTDLGATAADKTTGVENAADNFTVIVIVVAVAVLVLSVAAIVTIMLVRRHAHNRQQGVYSVPTEQDQKGAV